MALKRPLALGMKSHTGWAALVALAGPADAAEVVAKRSIVMATRFEEGAVYHAGQRLSLAEAEELIRASQARFERGAREALAALAAELRAAGLEPLASAVVWGDGKPLPSLTAILRSHALVHAAEGELYRRVLACATEAFGLPTLRVPAKEVQARAAGALGIAPSLLGRKLAALGKASGKPWAQDQKEAALAAWIALVQHERVAKGRARPLEHGRPPSLPGM